MVVMAVAADTTRAGLVAEDTTAEAPAVAAGIDGLFLEVHDDPANARSDGANALRLDLLAPLLERVAGHAPDHDRPLLQRLFG